MVNVASTESNLKLEAIAGIIMLLLNNDKSVTVIAFASRLNRGYVGESHWHLLIFKIILNNINFLSLQRS
jgi:hypothetical protein